ncbi:hypothetical protein GOOTI_169_00220 [Gordonia otitidis NBRC 100426]|uniref:MspA family protein n=2 Tax=Gordonia otitidis TaxID=249058 RepID=H5TPW6_GORO1|nr:hypothetical protein GOOTI_169_00220 [Gordonia otitidis NBRC 100426]
MQIDIPRRGIMKKSFTRGLTAAAALTGAAVMGLSGLGVGDAHANGKVTKVLVDGTPVTIEVTGEHVDIQRPTNLSPVSREAWGSGKVKVTVGGKAKGGSVKVGYEVGCQVNFGGELGVGDPGAGISVAPDTSGGLTPTTSGTLPAPSATATLGPGGVTQVWLIGNMGITSSNISNTQDSNYAVSGYTFSGNTGSFAYSQEGFRVNNCAGYAAARTIVQVSVKTDSVKGIVNYTGKQFSLG